MDEREDMLRSLVLHDDSVASILAIGVDTWHPPPIDAKTSALVRLGALIALNAPVVSYQSCITMALAAGATEDDIVDTLMAVAPVAGGVRVVAAALAIGYDIDAALEAHKTATPVRDKDP